MTEHARLFVNGTWMDAEGGATFGAVSPSTGEVFGTVAEGTRADRLTELKTVVLNLG